MNFFFQLLILQSLVKLGGRIRLHEILKNIETIMAEQLNEYDYELLPLNPKTKRWVKNAHWARFVLVEKGYLSSTSPRRIWEISDAGRTYLANHQKQIF